MESPLVPGGVMRQHHAPLLSFPTKTPPKINADTHILAAVHADLKEASPKADGWFVSDFYAFNLLFKGLGRSQTWLTAAAPEKIVETYGQLLHGNPFQDRKIVLNKDILDNAKITPVTVVKQKQMIEKFLHTLTELSEEAKRTKGNVLLLIFCHGIDAQKLALAGTKTNDVLSITRLQGALERYVPVCLITTACHSGGWAVSPAINTTAMTATGAESLSMSWPASESFGQFSGSIFASSIIDSLASATTELAQDAGFTEPEQMDSRLSTMGHEGARGQKTRMYNEFCHSVRRSCQARHRLWRNHTFTFAAQDDEWALPWNQSTATPLAYFEQRWSQLQTYPYGGSEEAKRNLDPSPSNPSFSQERPDDVRHGTASEHGSPQSPTTSGVTDSTTSQIGSDELHDPFLGPLLSSLYHRRIEEMVALWRMTCPGDENAGYWHIVNAFMSRCAETGQVIDVVTEDDIQNSDSDSEDIDARFNLADIIEYRLNIAQLAEHILYSLGLPRPGNTSCLSWNPYKWSDGIVADASYGFSDAFALQHHKDRLWMRMHNLGFSSRLLPTPQQGPIFSRFNRYLLAAVIEARPTSEAEEERIFHAMLNHIDKAQEFYKAKAQANPDVQRKFKKHFGRIWR